MNKNGSPDKVAIYGISSIAVILWGISYLWTEKLLGMGIPVSYFVFIRILIAGVALLVFNLISGGMKKMKRKDIPKFFLLAFFEPFIYFITESYGLQLTGSPTISAMVIATIPIFSIIAGRVFFSERLTKANVAGILLTVAGIILVVMSGGEVGADYILGIAVLLVAVFSEVGHAIVTKKLSGNYSSNVIVMYQFLIGSLYLLPVFIFKGLDDFSPFYFSLDVWIPIICLSLLCSSLAFSLWVNTIKHLGVAKSSIFAALIPVISAIASFILGYEMLCTRQWTGVALATVGVILSQYSIKRKA
ncbi:MAG: DMT family transporter [Candidatus Cryptobacteroides sp.]